ncbi:hypothetical protein [Alkalihalobacillus sp. LMS39]|uniref:hypothetical protein n=1 Tax=Alkalihalobacillus sp. LMS39 TaxID=2924032 RepID=UPI001FB413CE|nr:hypothetical protein [Alkalihalobacillus sp. LMS39]UOE95569.1 hypothetical protein MM271_08170 [Alkalihalobacillus sp. LMS39]
MRGMLLAVGLGVAAYTMRDKKSRNRMTDMIKPIKNMNFQAMMPEKSTMKRVTRKITKAIA